MRQQERNLARATVEADPRWEAVKGRDARADGSFYYSVATTGVYCRPSCAARLARPENVAFHRTAAEAKRAGFRPCRRCKPDLPPLADRQAALVARLCRLIEGSEEIPSLAELAESAKMSVFHLHRLFKGVTGCTPKAYAEAHRAGRVRRDLRAKGSVTEAIYSAGYGSSARFYEKSRSVLGMTPSAYRAGGADEVIRVGVGTSSLGAVVVAATAKGVCAISIGDDTDALVRELRSRFPRAKLEVDSAFDATVAEVVALLEEPRAGCRLPLDVRGTVFQKRVWDALRKITPGTTASYTEIARAIGAPRAARAVARACGANVLAVAVPCHRVVRSDGDAGGYRWGAARKRALLARESKA